MQNKKNYYLRDKLKSFGLRLTEDSPNIIKARETRVRKYFTTPHPHSDLPALFGCSSVAIKYWEKQERLPFWLTNQMDNIQKQIEANSKWLDHMRGIEGFYTAEVPIVAVYNFLSVLEYTNRGISMPFLHCIYKTVDKPIYPLDKTVLSFHIDKLKRLGRH